ncbi:hypothetical protein B0H13DRAFT_2314367 [Mycena leptocephala]|nr:hypothetical protein B0H13DRAFT_2314367 [Mycena leptocephala]
MHVVSRLLSFSWAASALSVSVAGGTFSPFLPAHFLELFPKKELFTNPSPATSSSPVVRGIPCSPPSLSPPPLSSPLPPPLSYHFTDLNFFVSQIYIPQALTGWHAGQHLQVRALIGGRTWESRPLTFVWRRRGLSVWKRQRDPQTFAVDGVLFLFPDSVPQTCWRRGLRDRYLFSHLLVPKLLLTSTLFPSQAPTVPVGMLLATRACGDWSRSLHAFALTPDFGDAYLEDVKENVEEEERDLEAGADGITHEKREISVHANALRARTAGPRDFERVLLFAGGSGVTFTLGVLDELVGRCVRLGRRDGEKMRRVVWCWCVRSFAPYLLQIATLAARPDSGLDLRIRIFVACLCDPSALSRIPGCTVTEARPSVGAVLDRLLDPVAAPGADYCGALAPVKGAGTRGSSAESMEELPKEVEVDLEMGEVDVGANESESGRGGVAVFAAGPGSLIWEAGNAVALVNLGKKGGARAGWRSLRRRLPFE